MGMVPHLTMLLQQQRPRLRACWPPRASQQPTQAHRKRHSDRRIIEISGVRQCWFYIAIQFYWLVQSACGLHLRTGSFEAGTPVGTWPWSIHPSIRTLPARRQPLERSMTERLALRSCEAWEGSKIWVHILDGANNRVPYRYLKSRHCMSFPRSRAPLKYAGARRTKGTTVPYSSYLDQVKHELCWKTIHGQAMNASC